ncbi:MAG: hypothetical protein AAF542_12475 [Pseudomonadota bacterium]
MVSKARRRWRLAKTLILAVVATVVLVGSAIKTWGADPEEQFQFFLLCLLMIAATAVLGALLAGLLIFIRGLRK